MDPSEKVDVIRAREIKARGEESFPAEVVDALVGGESPVRVFRKYRGLTMDQLAEKAGISQPAISSIESGRRIGRPNTMKAIAAALGVGLDDIM